MKLLNANCFPIAPAIVLMASVEGATKVVMHPVQRLGWERVALEANAYIYDPKEFPDFSKHRLTMGGLPIEDDASLDESWVEFRNDKNETLSRIEHLAIPFQRTL